MDKIRINHRLRDVLIKALHGERDTVLSELDQMKNDIIVKELHLAEMDEQLKYLEESYNLSIISEADSAFIRKSAVFQDFGVPAGYFNFSWWEKVQFLLKDINVPVTAQDIIKFAIENEPHLDPVKLTNNIHSTLSYKSKSGELNREMIGNVFKFWLKEVSIQENHQRNLELMQK